jgi:hypothetical protein
MAISETSYREGSSACRIEVAELIETSCSTERPPYTIPTRVFAIAIALYPRESFAEAQRQDNGEVARVLKRRVLRKQGQRGDVPPFFAPNVPPRGGDAACHPRVGRRGAAGAWEERRNVPALSVFPSGDRVLAEREPAS